MGEHGLAAARAASAARNERPSECDGAATGSSAETILQKTGRDGWCVVCVDGVSLLVLMSSLQVLMLGLGGGGLIGGLVDQRWLVTQYRWLCLSRVSERLSDQ